MFPLLYVVLAIPAGIALRRAFRPTLLLGAWLTALGGAVRLGDTYTTALIGQILVAIAQPLLLNAVAGVAGRERQGGGDRLGRDLRRAPRWRCRSRPALSIPTLLRVDAIVAVSGGHRALRDDSARAAPWRCRPCRDTGGRWRPRSSGFGVFVALMTWMQALLEPAGVSEDDRRVAAVHDGASPASPARRCCRPLRRRGRERAFLRTAAVIAAAAASSLAFAPDAAWLVVVPLGAVLLGALPVLLSQADNALVWLAGNTGGIVVAVLVQAFNQTPALAFSLLAAIAASVLAVA